MKRYKVIFILIILLFGINVNAVRAKVYYHGNLKENKIYLTFDDGYSAKNTEKILDILKAKKVTATFFIEGGFIKENPIIVKRIADEQILANHTYSHKNITKMSNEELINDIKKWEEVAYEITGKTFKKYFRPPMGVFDEEKLNILGDLGYTVFMWNVNYYDYVPNNDKGVDFVINNILNQTTDGSIILMHTLTKSNVDALDSVIDILREKGFVFSSLNDLV